MMKRRAFITLLGGAAVALPLAARAQQPERMRRIGVLMNLAAADPESTARVTAFAQGLQESGWTIGRNVQIDTRWAAADADLFRRYAAELVALAPDVILASGSPAMMSLQQLTRTVPIVLVNIVDPVIQAAAPSFGVELRAVGVRDAGEIERAITAFARSSNGGLIVTGSPLTLVHRDLIITLAARYRLPADRRVASNARLLLGKLSAIGVLSKLSTV
jgi:ABC-type uncharacterized transport system substrate-binding protein